MCEREEEERKCCQTKRKKKRKECTQRWGSGRRLCNGDMMMMDMEYKAGRGIVKGLNHLVCIHDGRG